MNTTGLLQSKREANGFTYSARDTVCSDQKLNLILKYQQETKAVRSDEKPHKTSTHTLPTVSNGKRPQPFWTVEQFNSKEESLAQVSD